VRDLALGGAFLETRLHLEVGNVMQVEVLAGLPPFTANAIVRSVTPYGIGIEFQNMTPEDIKLLRGLINSLLE
jgi:hypothetical protein